MSKRAKVGDVVGKNTVLFVPDPTLRGERRGPTMDFSVVAPPTDGRRETVVPVRFVKANGGNPASGHQWWAHMDAKDMMDMGRFFIRLGMELNKQTKGDGNVG